MAEAPRSAPSRARDPPFLPLVTVVGFHHARGPEVETWFGVPEGSDPAAEHDWSLLPFMALSDGAHAATEDFSYFTLLRPATATAAATSLFGISCTRQMDAAQLRVRPADVTRSTVQKAVVVIADSPRSFGMLRERLRVVTKAWFALREFGDTEILRAFQESLADERARARALLTDEQEAEEHRDDYLGMNLRELVHEFRWQTLVLLKCCLLQPKMLFFGSRCERLCMMQFSLISLVPGLLQNLQDCAGPDLDSYARTLTRPTSVKSSNRGSLLSYMGLPLQIFGRGSLFGPYTPLQQLDVLADRDTRSYIVGSTNSLLLQQRDRYSDMLVNLDDDIINITSPSLRTALQLSVPDRRWIDGITQEVNDTWDAANPGRPATMGFRGSEEFIRFQFEEYLQSLLASVSYHNHLARRNGLQQQQQAPALLPDMDGGDPAADFNTDWVAAWSRTENYRIWAGHTGADDLFNMVEPRHPCAGGLTMDDVQRRFAQQVQDLHLDERLALGREALGRNLAAGRDKASSIFNRLYADVEARREARQQQQQQQQQQGGAATMTQSDRNGAFASVDLAKAQQTMQSVGVKAGALVNSWAAWAGEKRKAGWGRSSSSSPSALSPTKSAAGSEGSGGGSSGWGFGSSARGSKSRTPDGTVDMSEKVAPGNPPVVRRTGESEQTEADARPTTQRSYSENIFEATATEIGGGSDDGSPRKPGRPLSGTPKRLSRGVGGGEAVRANGPVHGQGPGEEEEDGAETGAEEQGRGADEHPQRQDQGVEVGGATSSV